MKKHRHVRQVKPFDHEFHPLFAVNASIYAVDSQVSELRHFVANRTLIPIKRYLEKDCETT